MRTAFASSGVCLLILHLLPIPAASQPQPQRPLQDSELLSRRMALPDYDRRQNMTTGISETRKQLAQAFQRITGAGARVEFDARTGGVRHLFHNKSAVAPPRVGQPKAILSQLLGQNVELFGLSPAGIAAFETASEYRDSDSGVTHLHLRRRMQGIGVFGDILKTHIDSGGRVISVEGHYYPSIAPVNGTPRLSARDAVLAAMRSAVPDLLDKLSARAMPQAPVPPPSGQSATVVPGSAAVFPRIIESKGGADMETVMDAGPFLEPIRAQLVIFPESGRSALAWQVYLHAPDRQAAYTILIDAHSGELLFRSNSYRSAVNSNASVFLQHPEATPLTLVPFFGDPVSSPDGWSWQFDTMGNNTHVPGATSIGDFIYPFSDAWRRNQLSTFDLANKRLRFTPRDAPANSYTLTVSNAPTVTPRSINVVPSLSPNGDDGTAQWTCGLTTPFSVTILGRTFTSWWTNSNGSVGFGGGSIQFLPFKSNLSQEAIRVAGFWTDLDPRTGTFTTQCSAEGAGVAVSAAWVGVPSFGDPTTSHTFSITVHGAGTGLDNVIDIDFNSMSVLTGTLVGFGGNSGASLDPQTAGSVSYVDLSAGFASGIPGGIAETFPGPDVPLVATNISYHLNRLHDYFHQLGFTEGAGNFQVSNYSRGGQPMDPVTVEYGGSFNNASMSTPPDGRPPFMSFGMWQTGNCRKDSALDATIVIHEFVHGVTNRMVGGPLNVSALRSSQAGAMGEGWSDGFAALILNDPVIGAYVACSPNTGIRSVAYNASPLKYSDFGNRAFSIPAGIDRVFLPQVHVDGEIWASAMWDIKEAIGATRAGRLLFEALKYTPVEPSMIDARNAILIADLVVHGGANHDALFHAFAARGLGLSASSSSGDGNGGNGWDSAVFAAFDTPSNPYGTAKLELFSDDFDHGQRGWTVQGVDGAGGSALWHISSRRASSGSMAAYYGRASTGNYDTGFRNYGSMISPAIRLPAEIGKAAIVLEWDQYKNTECCFVPDGGWVRIIDVGGGEARKQVAFTSTSPASFGGFAFEHLQVNLNQFAGKTIRVEFFMDTFDQIINTPEGWYVDNVKVSILGAPANGGFEGGMVSPWTPFGGVSGAISAAVARTGGFSLAQNSGNGGHFQDVSGLVPGQVYSIGAWMRGTLGGAARAFLMVHDGIGVNASSTPSVLASSSWELLQLNFTASGTGKVRIHLRRLAGTGAVFWDDIGIAIGAPGAGNAGFENGGLAPWIRYGGVNASITNAASNSGSFSLAESGSGGGVFQDIAGLAPGQIYQIIARARSAPATSGQGILWVHDTSGANTSADLARTPPGSHWEQFTVNFVATATGRLRIHLHYTGGAGTVFWDDVQVVQGGTSPLLVNGGFESSTSGWFPYGILTTQRITSSKAHSGSFSLEQAAATVGGGIFQDVPGLVPGQTYQVGVWVLGTGGNAPVLLWAHDTNNVNIAGSPSVVPGTAWQFIEIDFVATTTAKVRIHLHLFPGSGTVFYDDVSVR